MTTGLLYTLIARIRWPASNPIVLFEREIWKPREEESTAFEDLRSREYQGKCSLSANATPYTRTVRSTYVYTGMKTTDSVRASADAVPCETPGKLVSYVSTPGTDFVGERLHTGRFRMPLPALVELRPFLYFRNLEIRDFFSASSCSPKSLAPECFVVPTRSSNQFYPVRFSQVQRTDCPAGTLKISCSCSLQLT